MYSVNVIKADTVVIEDDVFILNINTVNPGNIQNFDVSNKILKQSFTDKQKDSLDVFHSYIRVKNI